jgi:hypothetical protein
MLGKTRSHRFPYLPAPRFPASQDGAAHSERPEHQPERRWLGDARDEDLPDSHHARAVGHVGEKLGGSPAASNKRTHVRGRRQAAQACRQGFGHQVRGGGDRIQIGEPQCVAQLVHHDRQMPVARSRDLPPPAAQPSPCAHRPERWPPSPNGLRPRTGHISLYCQPAAVRDRLRERTTKTILGDLPGGVGGDVS